jgi:hypothetical protein
VLKIHGGAWNDKDRTDGQNTAMELVNSGILVEDHPGTPNSKKALATIKSFIKKHGQARQAAR